MDEVRSNINALPPSHTVTIHGETTQAVSNIRQVDATAKSLPKNVTVTAHGEVRRAIQNIRAVQANLNALRDRTVYVTTVHRTVVQKAKGGIVGFARGGSLPGFGGGDRIHAMLEAGEFVIRKEAVRRYGLGLFDALNRMRLNLAEIPRFALGGMVNNLVIPSLPSMAMSGGGTSSPQVESVIRLDINMNDRQSASVTAPRDQIRGLVDTLKEMQRGL